MKRSILAILAAGTLAGCSDEALEFVVTQAGPIAADAYCATDLAEMPDPMRLYCLARAARPQPRPLGLGQVQ